MSRTKKQNIAADAPDELSEATKSGDRLRTLIALRDLLADKLQNTASTRDIAAISRRLMQCVSEIETLEKEKKYEKEDHFDIYYFRRKLRGELGAMQQEYKLNPIDREHEVS